MYFEPMYPLTTPKSTFTSAHIPALSFVCLFILVTCEDCFALLLYLCAIGSPVTCGHLPVFIICQWLLRGGSRGLLVLHARMLIGLLLFSKPQMPGIHECSCPAMSGRHLSQFSPVPASFRFSDPFLRNVINRNSFWALACF